MTPSRDTAHPQPAPLTTTRWHATSTTFGPTVKLALSIPPFWMGVDMLLHLPSGAEGAFTAFYGMLFLAGGVWWARHVWVRARRVDPALPAPSPTRSTLLVGPSAQANDEQVS